MKIAVWNLPPAELFASGLSSGDRGDQIEVQRVHVPDCERMLMDGQVDAALLPTVTVLDRHADLDVVPAVALSSWTYPFARLVIHQDLGTTVGTVAFCPEFEQERFLAALILREHYGVEPDFEAHPGAEPDELLDAAADACLLVGPNVPTLSLEGRVLDIGQEWFELAAYPMTWGLFATRKDQLDTCDIRRIRDGVFDSERQKKVWIRARETSKPLHAFFVDSLRFRLDNLCVAGLTELRQFLFYYDRADDVPDIPFVYLPDDEEDGDDGSKPML